MKARDYLFVFLGIAIGVGFCMGALWHGDWFAMGIISTFALLTTTVISTLEQS